MEGYSSVFNRAVSAFSESTAKESQDEIFASFRERYEMYGFLHNGNKPYDEEAETLAIRTDPFMFHSYYERNQTKKLLGYGNIPDPLPYNELDSRHIMMSIILFANLPTPVKTIAEIGGGFGNWLWLNHTIQPFDHWTIIDLPHVNELQRWYLNAQGVPSNLYSLVSADEFSSQPYDLVIGSHSLSEFSIDVFHRYFSQILTRCKYLFYAHHIYGPSLDLINQKQTILQTTFEEIACVQSERGLVMNRLMRNKFITSL
jgi:hypothetical protein